VTLVSKHGLTINDPLVSLVIVQGCCLVGTTADRDVRGYAASEVVLLSMELEKALKLGLSHAWLDVLHNINVAFNCDLGRRSLQHVILPRCRAYGHGLL
jgi:hypothetical protein